MLGTCLTQPKSNLDIISGRSAYWTEIRDWFETVGHQDLLAKINHFNAIFFGASGLTEWTSPLFWGGEFNLALWKPRVESHCGIWTYRLLRTMRPSKLLMIGLSNFNSNNVLPFLRVHQLLYIPYVMKFGVACFEGHELPVPAVAHASGAKRHGAAATEQWMRNKRALLICLRIFLDFHTGSDIFVRLSNALPYLQ